MPEMKPISLFEHETRDVDFSELECQRWSAFLERIKNPLRIQYSGRGAQLVASEWVGIVRLGDRTVEVLPKLFQLRNPDPNDLDARERLRKDAMRNLLALLEVGGYLDIRHPVRADVAVEGGDWFEVLTFLFASDLLRQLALGPSAAYQTREESLAFVRGRLLIEQVARRPGSAHRPPCRFDEWTLDHPLNRTLLFACRLLSRITRSQQNLRYLLCCIALLQGEVETRSFLSEQEADAVVFNRLNERFRPVWNLARWLLRGSMPVLTAGRVDAFAFIVDMNKVFESAVLGLLTQHGEVLGSPWKEMTPIAQPARHYLAKAFPPREGREVFLLQPDLVFRGSDATYPLVIDAKYKWLAPNDNQWNVGSDDFYQMVAYSIGLPGVKKVLLVYPWVGEIPVDMPRFVVNRAFGSMIVIAVGCLPVDRPLSRRDVGREAVVRLSRILETGG